MNPSLPQNFRESTEYNTCCLLDSLWLNEWGVTETSNRPVSLRDTWGNPPKYPGQENLYHLPPLALMFMSALTSMRFPYQNFILIFFPLIQVQSTILPKNQLKYMCLCFITEHTDNEWWFTPSSIQVFKEELAIQQNYPQQLSVQGCW
jgi:hypothetical protein